MKAKTLIQAPVNLRDITVRLIDMELDKEDGLCKFDYKLEVNGEIQSRNQGFFKKANCCQRLLSMQGQLRDKGIAQAKTFQFPNRTKEQLREDFRPIGCAMKSMLTIRQSRLFRYSDGEIALRLHLFPLTPVN